MTGDTVTYDPSSDTYHADYSLEDPDHAADAIVTGIAEIENVDPIDLDPLGAVVDTDALHDIFQPTGDGGANFSVSFQYSGYRVTVTGDESITFERVE